MSIAYATQEQIDEARAAVVRAGFPLQQFVQGSLNPETADADVITETDDLVDAAILALQAVQGATAPEPDPEA